MAKLILYKNKEFDVPYLAACMIKFCDHKPDQAEQCAIIVNGKGEYAIKHGDPFDLEEIAFLFDNVGLETKIIE